MDTKRAVLAVALSFLILVAFQYLFVPPPEPVQKNGKPADRQAEMEREQSTARTFAIPDNGEQGSLATPSFLETEDQGQLADFSEARDIVVETDLYIAVISEIGGGFKSFRLKHYREEVDDNSDEKELVKTSMARELPLFFSWGVPAVRSGVPLYKADKEKLEVRNGSKKLVLTATLPSGALIRRSMTFRAKEYLIDLDFEVINQTGHEINGKPLLSMTNKPFSAGEGNRTGFLFKGPALYQNSSLEEIKVDDIEEGGEVRSGAITWTAYEDTYFMTGIIPANKNNLTVGYETVGQNKVRTVVAEDQVILPPGRQIGYQYKTYLGPKRLKNLKAAGYHLPKIVNFGWFDVLAKPMLHLLQFLYSFLHNYGFAIIMTTVIVKLVFWPISHKGMKSMKTMQKLQPKMAKLREKYKNDKETLNREMMQLYRTYKVNPVGGCLPLLAQIPVFVALYKVLLQTIELRHAPFMLWINDLSAPERLPVGFDIPYLGGIPVLTLLMGLTMYWQQKLTPTTGDPTQAKIMKFLPVIFIFVFINFSAGLVLYMLVTNLLAIAQQYYINRST